MNIIKGIRIFFKTFVEEVEIKQKYSTVNAMVRDLIRKNEL